MYSLARNLVKSAFFIIIFSTAVSNLYQLISGYVHALVNSVVLKLFSKDSLFINIVLS